MKTIHLRPGEDVVRGVIESVEADGLVLVTTRERCRVHVAVPRPEAFRGREGDEVAVRGVVTPEGAERCRSTCPHGDRCTLDAGHDGGHNHRRCDCNEPNTDATEPPPCRQCGLPKSEHERSDRRMRHWYIPATEARR